MALLADEHVKQAFDLYDADASGAIDKRELDSLMMALGFGKLSEPDLETLMQELDTDGSGVIEWDEFRRMVRSKAAAKDSVEEMHLAFKSFDIGHKGFITVDDLCQVARSIGEHEQPSVYRQVFRRVNGMVGAPADAKPADESIGIDGWVQMCAEAISTKRRPHEVPTRQPAKVWQVEPQVQQPRCCAAAPSSQRPEPRAARQSVFAAPEALRPAPAEAAAVMLAGSPTGTSFASQWEGSLPRKLTIKDSEYPCCNGRYYLLSEQHDDHPVWCNRQSPDGQVPEPEPDDPMRLVFYSEHRGFWLISDCLEDDGFLQAAENPEHPYNPVGCLWQRAHHGSPTTVVREPTAPGE
eukprot:TRINITY_DN5778_c0_g1_i1.p1 TRINITY_DN5778_c0_g1~~TRINITY_DN5778_c0_g1_i1.p1  ORF type:complete len:381 (+),score=87.93 TRINITY_DN5778_c0_g1_i1:89-1144(+)